MTTSLHRPAPTVLQRDTRAGESGVAVPHADSFEIIPREPSPTNGVPRNSWRRGRPRVSRWHRPYIAALLLLDIGSATLASLTAIASHDQTDAGYRAIDVWVFFAIAF